MVAVLLALAPAMMVTAAYIGYPAVLAILAARKPRWSAPSGPLEWPTITITIPVYNEEASIGTTIEALLGLDHPRDSVQIVVISDASTDRTDEIVRRFAGQGVELIRLPERRGKSAAENAAGAIARGDVIVNIDATVRLRPGSLEALARAFRDPTVGVASGRDVSVGASAARSPRSESGYVGYEMCVR